MHLHCKSRASIDEPRAQPYRSSGLFTRRRNRGRRQKIAGGADMTARLTLICHASTTAVRAAAFAADEPLDSLGRASAASLAGHIDSAARCWTSPELRTRQTAEA